MYRKDIDGLRAAAVIPVVLFHAGFSSLSGGYVGVDMFFVISGYLITDHLYKEVQNGRIDIFRFYERRIRRIFPAFFFLLSCVLIAGLLLLLPLELSDLGRSALWASLSAANIWFYVSSDYFSPAAETKPLLHTWSLGIEEQFYLFWPIALWLLYKYARNHLFLLTASLCALSLALSAVLIHISPSAAFYLLPTRAWELLAGAALAITPYRPQLYRGGIAVVGAVMIAVPMVAYTKDTLFPGLAALPVVLGTILIIASAENTLVGRCLSTRPMRGIGMISYSLYLWHWPPLAFANLAYNFAIPTTVSVICVLTAVVMAALSWRFVEQPFRRPAVRTGRPHPSLLGGAVATASFAICAAALFDGLPSRLPTKVLSVAVVAAPPDLSMTPCFREGGENPQVSSCLAQRGDDMPANVTVLWGDSHARPFASALRQRAEDLRFVGRAGCLPVIDVVPERADRLDERCASFNEEVFAELIKARHVDKVILAGRWARLFFPAEDAEAQQLVTREGGSVSPEAVLRHSIRKTVDQLEASGKEVIVIGDVPEFTTSLPECVARAMWLNVNAACHHHADTLPNSRSAQEMRKIAQDVPNAAFVWPHEFLCPRGTCMRTLNGLPVMTDTDHLTDEAAEYVLAAAGLGQAEAGLALPHHLAQ